MFSVSPIEIHHNKFRLYCLSLFLFAQVNVGGQTVNDIVWEDPIAVASGLDNNRPRLVLNNEQQPVVMWGQDNGRQLHVAVFDGSAFQIVPDLLPEGLEIFTADWAGPDLDANGGVVGLVFKGYPEDVMGAYYMQSLDGGFTWSDTIRIDSELPVGMQTRFPSLGLDQLGEAAVTLMTFEGNYEDPTYEVSVGMDENTTFGSLQNTSTAFFDGEACDCCMADLVHSEDQLIQLYRNNDSNVREIRATRSTNNGMDWNDSYACDVSGTYSNVCFSSGPSGQVRNTTLYTTYRSNQDEGVRVQLSMLDLISGDLIEYQNLDPEVEWNVSQNNPRLATNALYTAVVWEEIRTTSTNVLLSLGTQLDDLTSAHDTVNVEFSGRQINPDVWLDETHIHVVWQDKYLDQVMYRRGVLPEPTEVDQAELAAVLIFPVPCRESLRLSSPNQTLLVGATVRVFDPMGRWKCIPVLSRTEHQVELETSSLSPGVWIIPATEFGNSLRFVKH